MLSQLAVFKDIIPGYRIRELTVKEKSEKVGQMVARTREWEQGLVSVYQTYLKCLDSELKGRQLIPACHPKYAHVQLRSKVRLRGRSPAMFVYTSCRGHTFQFPHQYYECRRRST
jgi:Nucleolar complex-associated protein